MRFIISTVVIKDSPKFSATPPTERRSLISLPSNPSQPQWLAWPIECKGSGTICGGQVTWHLGLPPWSLGALTFRMLQLGIQAPYSKKSKPHGEATSTHLGNQPLSQPTVSIDCRPCECAILGVQTLSLRECVMQQWITGTPNLKTSDYWVTRTVKNREKRTVIGKVLHKRKVSLLMSWVPPLPFLSCPKEQLWALVPAHSNFLPWLWAHLSDLPAQLLRKAEIRERSPWDCSPEVPDPYAYVHSYISGFPST